MKMVVGHGLRSEAGSTRLRLAFPALAGLMTLGVLLALLSCPALLRGQAIAREALASFPADTNQFAYANLAELRTLPNFPQIRRRLLNGQMNTFEEFLRSLGVDPAKQVDEVVLGWHGDGSEGAGFFGLANGRFDPDAVAAHYKRSQLPWQSYQGTPLYAFGSGEARGDLFFAFLSTSEAAFGHLDDLEWLLDVRAGVRPALDANRAWINWEADLEGSSSQWGITSGKAAGALAAMWLAGGAKPLDLSPLFAPVQAVLYRLDWGASVTARLSIDCRDAASAGVLAELLGIWRDTVEAVPDRTSPSFSAFFQSLDIYTNGARIDVTGAGPIDVIQPFKP